MGLWVGTSKDRKTIHMEMEKQVFGKWMSAGPSFIMGLKEDFDETGLAGFLSICHT